MRTKNVLCMIITLQFVLAYSCIPVGKDEKLLKSYKLTDGRIVNIYYVDAGATTKEVIQVRVGKDTKNERVIMNFENNYLQSSAILNDTVLMIGVTDSGSTKTDTSFVKLKR